MAAETLPRPVPERFCYAPPLLEWLRDPANTRPALVSEGWRVIHRIHFEKAAEAIGLAMRLYLAGPMTGHHLHNFPAFEEAVTLLTEYTGNVIVSPHQLSYARAGLVSSTRVAELTPADWERITAWSWEASIRDDLREMLACDAVALLPGWEKSRGANRELDTARATGMQVFAFDPNALSPRELLAPSEATAIPGMLRLAPRRSPEYDPYPQAEHLVMEHELREAGIPPEGGLKSDDGKPRTDLIPGPALLPIAEVFGFGAEKYAPHNWRKGLAWSRLYAATLRHLFAWGDGQTTDPESGKSHLAHAGCDLLMLIYYEMNGVGTDDRPKAAE